MFVIVAINSPGSIPATNKREKSFSTNVKVIIPEARFLIVQVLYLVHNSLDPWFIESTPLHP